MLAETGVMKFKDDCFSVFIRGEDAFKYAISLREVLATTLAEPDTKSKMESLLSLLESVSEANDWSGENPDFQTAVLKAVTHVL